MKGIVDQPNAILAGSGERWKLTSDAVAPTASHFRSARSHSFPENKTRNDEHGHRVQGSKYELHGRLHLRHGGQRGASTSPDSSTEADPKL